MLFSKILQLLERDGFISQIYKICRETKSLLPSYFTLSARKYRMFS